MQRDFVRYRNKIPRAQRGSRRRGLRVALLFGREVDPGWPVAPGIRWQEGRIGHSGQMLAAGAAPTQGEAGFEQAFKRGSRSFRSTGVKLGESTQVQRR